MNNKVVYSLLILCIGAITTLPLVFDTAMGRPYLFPRALLFQIFLEIAAGLWLILMVRDPGYRPYMRHPIILGFTGYAAILLLIFPFSTDPFQSLFSTPDWMMGLVMLAHFWFFFILLSGILKTRQEWQKYFSAMLVVASLVALYGILQFYNFPFAPRMPEFGARITSTIGNPIYLASYLLVNVFLASILFLRAKNFYPRLFIGTAAFLCVVAILLSGSRGVMLTLGVSAIALVLYFTFETQRKKRKSVIFFLVGLGAFVIGGFILLRFTIPKDSLPINVQRLVYFSLQDTGRQALMEIGWKGFLARSIVGWGQENFNIVFSTYVPSPRYGIKYRRDYPTNSVAWAKEEDTIEKKWYDRAHNQFIEVLATTGLLGALGFSIAWFAVFYTVITGWRRAEKREERRIFFIIGVALAAYHIQNFSVFDTPMAYLAVMSVVGFLVYYTPHFKVRTPIFSVSFPAKTFLCLVLAGLLILSIGNTSSYIKARSLSRATETITHNFRFGLQLFEDSIEGFTFFQKYFIRDFAQAALFLAKNKSLTRDQEKTLFALAITKMEGVVSGTLHDVRDIFILSRLYRAGGDYNPGYYQRGYQLLSKAAVQYPQYQDVLTELIDYALVHKEYSRAIELSDRLVRIDPKAGEPYWVRSRIFLEAKNFDSLFQELSRAAYRYPIYRNGSFFIRLAQETPLAKTGEAIAYIEEELGAYPALADYHIARFILLMRSGKSKEAQDELRWIDANQPDLAPQVEELLRGMAIKTKEPL